jgi:hypothetical protein
MNDDSGGRVSAPLVFLSWSNAMSVSGASASSKANLLIALLQQQQQQQLQQDQNTTTTSSQTQSSSPASVRVGSLSQSSLATIVGDLQTNGSSSSQSPSQSTSSAGSSTSSTSSAFDQYLASVLQSVDGTTTAPQTGSTKP